MNFWPDLRQPMAENNERETCKSASSAQSEKPLEVRRDCLRSTVGHPDEHRAMDRPHDGVRPLQDRLEHERHLKICVGQAFQLLSSLTLCAVQ
jgi:hypothetical protein